MHGVCMGMLREVHLRNTELKWFITQERESRDGREEERRKEEEEGRKGVKEKEGGEKRRKVEKREGRWRKEKRGGGNRPVSVRLVDQQCVPV